MLFKPLPFVCFAIAAQDAYALSIHRRTDRFVKLPVIHSTKRRAVAEGHEGKRDVTPVHLGKESDVAYYAELNIGTPPQKIGVQLDTGSFELWVNPDCSNLQVLSEIMYCTDFGHYNSSLSSTAVELASKTTLRYGIGTANIQYVKDTVGLSGTDTLLKDVQFGVAVHTADVFSGILGIGFGNNATIRYKNLIDQLADQGVTNTKAFSLALGSKSEKEGGIIFGGLDTSKFTGTLQTLPIIPAASSPDNVPRYWVNMESLSLSPPKENTKQYPNSSMPVFLDSGSTLSLLPEGIASAVAADFDAGDLNSSGFYPVDCKYAKRAGTLDFAFDGVTIRVPYQELIREAETLVGTECYLGFGPSDDFVLLGDTVLRSAYVVFDQTNNAIRMAQYANCGTNEQEITSQMDWSSVKGDCEAPDFGAAGMGGDPLSKSPPSDDEDSSDDHDSSAIRPEVWGLGWLLLFWAVFLQQSLGL